MSARCCSRKKSASTQSPPSRLRPGRPAAARLSPPGARASRGSGRARRQRSLMPVHGEKDVHGRPTRSTSRSSASQKRSSSSSGTSGSTTTTAAELRVDGRDLRAPVFSVVPFGVSGSSTATGPGEALVRPSENLSLADPSLSQSDNLYAAGPATPPPPPLAAASLPACRPWPTRPSGCSGRSRSPGGCRRPSSCGLAESWIAPGSPTSRSRAAVARECGAPRRREPLGAHPGAEGERRDAARPRASRPLPRRLHPVDDDFIRRFIASAAENGIECSGFTIR